MFIKINNTIFNADLITSISSHGGIEYDSDGNPISNCVTYQIVIHLNSYNNDSSQVVINFNSNEEKDLIFQKLSSFLSAKEL